MYLEPSDLTSIYNQEQIDELTRNDAAKTERALRAAEGEARSYLSRFDLLKLFGSDTVAPTITDITLKLKVTEIAAWQLQKIGGGSAGVDAEFIKVLNDDAIKWLKACNKGDADPEGWPLKPVAADGTHPADNITYRSEGKRSNRF